jgi:Ca-activated chloride channel family protein
MTRQNRSFSSLPLQSLTCAAAALLACGGRDSYMPTQVLSRMEPAAPPASAPPAPAAAARTEQYDPIAEVDFRRADEQPLSTFSVDVDTASYSNVRRFLRNGQRPPKDAVRIEELINYFSYTAPAPQTGEALGVTSELADSPFEPRRKLLRVGIRASAPPAAAAPARNLVFLIDVSGSMQDEDKLPLLKQALELLSEQLGERDRVAIVTYAGSSGVVLEPTPGSDRARIHAAIDALGAGGATNGAAGIEQAYALARAVATPSAINRVLLATDGDFNVGVSDRGALVRLIEQERAQGIFLTVLGFGTGNLQDATLEQIADRGDGSYAYIDTLREARKVLVEQASATLRTVAKDTKVQIEFNPARVRRYRLIGYENRYLAAEAFNDDRKDAGDMGDGHAVTALYELELADTPDTGSEVPRIDALEYQTERGPSASAQGGELLTIKLRYKRPEGGASRLITQAVSGSARAFAESSADLRFAAAVAGFGMLLRGSRQAGAVDLAGVASMARGALAADGDGYRHEFLELVALAQRARD